MKELESLVMEANQLREQLGQPMSKEAFQELLGKITVLAGKFKTVTESAQAQLKDRALAFAAELKIKAEALRMPKAQQPAKTPMPHPWEDHQGLDPGQLQHMIDSLMQTVSLPARR